MEDESMKKCWRKEVDENLQRLHSLLFGVERALDEQNRDFSSAYILSLRLIGFIDSRSQSVIDQAFLQQTRRQALTYLHTAKQSLTPLIDRQAFEKAKRSPGPIFSSTGDIDIDKIRNSKYFQALLKPSKEKDCNQLVDQLGKHNKTGKEASKGVVQAKLTSIYGKSSLRTSNGSKSFFNLKNNNPEDCIVIGKAQSHGIHTKGPGVTSVFEVEGEGRACGNTFPTKRAHVETTSPRVGYVSSVFEVEGEGRACGNTFPTRRANVDNTSPRVGYVKSPSIKEEVNPDVAGNGFVTARAKLIMDVKQKWAAFGSPSAPVSPQCDNSPANRQSGGRSYGVSRRGIRGNFVPPIKSNGSNTGNITSRIAGNKCGDSLDESTKKCLEMLYGPDGELPEKLRNLEPRLIEHVSNEIMDKDPNVLWDDIAGLAHAKSCVHEMVILPLQRPDLFMGCRSPGRGLLLFGPPGTGKTMIGKAIAGEAKATFFYISASSLTSKWIGEGEKLVRALFGVASCRQPAVIFVDEIDSLLSQRKSEGEHEASRRLKTQFLIEMEGFDGGNDQILLIGATNRPQELDEAARRRLTKRLYIPLPSSEARAWIARSLLEKDGLFNLSNEEMEVIRNLTDGYSGSDMKNLVKDASMGPLREKIRQGVKILDLKKEDIRPVTLQDFKDSLNEVRPSVSPDELGTYEQWNKKFGSLAV